MLMNQLPFNNHGLLMLALRQLVTNRQSSLLQQQMLPLSLLPRSGVLPVQKPIAMPSPITQTTTYTEPLLMTEHLKSNTGSDKNSTETTSEAAKQTETKPDCATRRLKKQKRNRQPIRKHKSKRQLKLLAKIFEKYRGKMTRKVRREAVEVTGLKWIKIYKWFFDKQAKSQCPEVQNLLSDCRGCPNCSKIVRNIFKVTRKDGTVIVDKHRPLFKVERVRQPGINNFPTQKNLKAQ